MTTLCQSIGWHYSQTLRIGHHKNEVEVKQNGKTMYSGLATNIVDEYNKLSFKDKDGKKHEYIKQRIVTTA